MTRVRVDRPVRTGDVVPLDHATAHHIVRVLRLGAGAALTVVDGEGGLFGAVVGGLSPVVVVIGEPLEAVGANPRVALTVWLPLLKGGKTDHLVRQLTEVGASRIVPYLSRRSVVRLADDKASKRLARWQIIADEATRQCGRTDRVELAPLRREIPQDGTGVYFYARGRTPLARSLDGLEGDVAVLVGPEGGLDPSEADALRALGWREAWLGPRVLRAETAVLTAAVVTLGQLGELYDGR